MCLLVLDRACKCARVHSVDQVPLLLRLCASSSEGRSVQFCGVEPHRSIIWLVILRVAALVGLRMKTKSIVNFTWFLRYVGIGRQIRVRNGGKPLGPDPCPWWMSPPLARDHGLIAPSCTLVHGCDTRRHNRLGKLPHQWDY